MGALQPWHLIVILVIVLMVFGPGKLPDLGRSLGEGMRELKKATAEEPPTALAASSSPAPATAGLCPSCSSTLSAGVRFCGACGTEIGATTARTT